MCDSVQSAALAVRMVCFVHGFVTVLMTEDLRPAEMSAHPVRYLVKELYNDF